MTTGFKNGALVIDDAPTSRANLGLGSAALINQPIANVNIANPQVTINTSGGLSGGGTVALGGTLNLSGSGTGFNTINVQTFTSNGTYTPTSGMKFCLAEIVAGGGGAGGAGATGALQVSAGGGGGGGGYARQILSAADIGVSQSVTIGSGGTGGVGTGAATAGGNSSLGALLNANGGDAGQSTSAGTLVTAGGGPGGSGGSGDVNIVGSAGGASIALFSVSECVVSGFGGGSFFSGFTECRNGTGSIHSNGNDGQDYGAGGSGAANGASQSAATGGNGEGGFLVITEFI